MGSSNIPLIKAGDRIRMTRTVEGTITQITPTGFELDNGWRYNTTHHSLRYDTNLEVLEPRYEAGRAYIDADGDIFLRTDDGEWRDFHGSQWGDQYPTRPLHELVAKVN